MTLTEPRKRTALVTGGTKGIGLHTAVKLLDCGYHVLAVGRSASGIHSAKDHDSRLECIQGDMAEPEQVESVVRGCAPDVLVANAGLGYEGSLGATSVDAWNQVLDINVTSAFLAFRAALPRMVERGWGRMVAVGSLASFEPVKGGVAYTASKHALLGLVRASALELQNTGVTCSMVAPAFVRTDMARASAERMAAALGITVDEAERKLGGLSDIGRLLEPSEVAATILSLVDDATANGRVVQMGFDAGFQSGP